MCDLTILLPEPDSYKDIVLFFDSCLEKAWPDCPYPIFWMNGEETIDSPRIQAMNCGGNPLAFCGRVLDGVNHAGTKWVLIWTSDYIPTIRIDTADIEAVLNYMSNNDIKYCDLKKIPKLRMKKDISEPHFYRENEDSPYNISICFCIFQASYLKELIQDRNWTGWQLEDYGMKLSSEGKNTACAYYDKNIGRTVHLVTQGKLIPSTMRKLRKCGFDTSSLQRELLPREVEVRQKARKILGYICPTRLRKLAKITMSRFGIQYGSKY